jgi:predicted kinase
MAGYSVAKDLKQLEDIYFEEIKHCFVKDRPVIVVMSGLPGTGKSYFSEQLAATEELFVISSDRIRKRLVKYPKYTSNEHYRVFASCHGLIERLIKKNISVVFDATNLNKFAIQPLKRLSTSLNCRMVIALCVAPEPLVQSRLKDRVNGKDDYGSDADWDIYKMLKTKQTAITEPYYEIDSSLDNSSVIRAIQKFIMDEQ